MKHDNPTVAKLFAEDSRHAKGSNLFIDGDTIYSYGYHYPIAKRQRFGYMSVMLFNSFGSSVTTEKHKRYVRDELISAGWNVLEVPGADPKRLMEAVEHNNTTIKDLEGKASRARKEHTREYYLNRIERLKDQNETLGVCESLRTELLTTQ